MNLLSIPARLWTLLKIHGPFKVLFHYLPKIFLWKYNTLRVRRCYFQGQRTFRIAGPGNDELEFARDIFARGHALLSNINDVHRGILANRNDIRVLFYTQSSGAGRYFFVDLADCLQHTGIRVRHFDSLSEHLDAVLSSFRPSVFVSHDDDYSIQHLDVDVLARYKRDNRLARLIIPTLDSTPPHHSPSFSTFDLRRISFSSQKLADAYICYLEDAYWQIFCRPYADAGKTFLAIPFAVNPFRHVPFIAPKKTDWALATANRDLGARAVLTYRYMHNVMRRYSGHIVGHDWGIGIAAIPGDQVAEFFAQTRIAPNFASELNMRHPLDCGGKVHELLSVGVFQIASERAIMRQYYDSDQVVGCRNPREFEDLFDYFVHKPDVRHMYVINGQKRAIQQNTYFERIDRLVRFLDSNPQLFT